MIKHYKKKYEILCFMSSTNIYKALYLPSLMPNMNLCKTVFLALFMNLANFILAHKISLIHIYPFWPFVQSPNSFEFVFFIIRLSILHIFAHVALLFLSCSILIWWKPSKMAHDDVISW